MDRLSSDMDAEEVFEELVALRADFLIHHAFHGFGIDYEQALEILRTKEGLTPEQSAQRDILVAAVDNLIDFATAEEYHAAIEVEEELDEVDGEESGDEYDSEIRDEIIAAVCSKYNKRYAIVENNDVEYAMIVAAEISAVSNDSNLMYMTMGDERVRPWHLQYEGFTAPKHSFPGWLVPPIEHGCRCYLVEESASFASMKDIKAVMTIPEPPYWFNGTFKECVAFGGRIFSDEHPYFNINENDKDALIRIANKIKEKYFNAEDHIKSND